MRISILVQIFLSNIISEGMSTIHSFYLSSFLINFSFIVFTSFYRKLVSIFTVSPFVNTFHLYYLPCLHKYEILWLICSFNPGSLRLSFVFNSLSPCFSVCICKLHKIEAALSLLFFITFVFFFHFLPMPHSLRNQTSLIAQLLKNPPAVQESPVWFLGQEDPLEEG